MAQLPSNSLMPRTWVCSFPAASSCFDSTPRSRATSLSASGALDATRPSALLAPALVEVERGEAAMARASPLLSAAASCCALCSLWWGADASRPP